MRLFIGLPFSHQVRRDLLRVQKQLQKNAVKGNFTAVENFHLTLTFLGEVKEDRLPVVFDALASVPMGPFALTLDRLGSFEGGIWYLAPRPSPALMEGQVRLAQIFRERGFRLEASPYIPHVTLGRKILLREGYCPPSTLSRPILARSEGPWLFLSHRVEGALRYDVLTP